MSTFSYARLTVDRRERAQPALHAETRHALQRFYGGCPRSPEAHRIPVSDPVRPPHGHRY